MGKMKQKSAKGSDRVACAACGMQASKATMVAHEGRFYCAHCAPKA